MEELADALQSGRLVFCTIGKYGRDYQVAVRRQFSEGFSTFSGSDLEETLHRAINNGPQREPEPEEWGGLV